MFNVGGGGGTLCLCSMCGDSLVSVCSVYSVSVFNVPCVCVQCTLCLCSMCGDFVPVFNVWLGTL